MACSQEKTKPNKTKQKSRPGQSELVENMASRGRWSITDEFRFIKGSFFAMLCATWILFKYLFQSTLPSGVANTDEELQAGRVYCSALNDSFLLPRPLTAIHFSPCWQLKVLSFLFRPECPGLCKRVRLCE